MEGSFEDDEIKDEKNPTPALDEDDTSVARCTKIINPNTQVAKYVANCKENKEITLPENWTVESIPQNSGKIKKVYICGENKKRFYSRPQVLRYLENLRTKDGSLNEDIDQSCKIKPTNKDVNILMTHKKIPGKLKNSTSTPAHPPRSPDFISTPSWENVSGLGKQQKQSLGRLQTKGVLWKYPEDQNGDFVILRLSHGGDVKADGNCLFTALQKAMGGLCTIDAKELRRIAIKNFLENLESMSDSERKLADETVKNMYSQDNWGHGESKELKVLAKKQERQDLDRSINKAITCGMPDRKSAAKFVYEDKCIAVKDALTWAKYMSISGSPDDEYDIISLKHNKEGLLYVDENREGRAVAYGDDIALTALASEFNREIYVLLANGCDSEMVVEDCVFFLPHRPKSEIRWGLPIFLLSKGRDCCAGGGEHFEPVVARPSSLISREEVEKEL